MKKLFLHIMTAFVLLSFPTAIFAQAPTLGTAANFVLFSSDGAVTNTGTSHLTGNVGTNNGSSTGFGNVDGDMNDGGIASAQCSADLLIAYNQLNAAIPTFFPAPLLGNGATLIAGVYSISSAATLNGTLILNGQNNPNAVFIFKIQGSFSTNASSKIKLINGALACNVFWKVEGLVSMATQTTMRGTIIANNAAINMNVLDTLEGRALSTTGSITTNGVLAFTPIGCGSPYLTGPTAPPLGSTVCYTIFSSNGAVSNSGITNVTGDVGTNVGLTTGFNPAFVTGTVHPIPDASTAKCAADLSVVYNYLNALPVDINLLYPAQFGNKLVLTPHTYLLDAATVFTDTVFLNAEGNANAVFVIKINGALTTSTYSTVALVNGTQAKNVFWKIEGAVNLNNYSVFNGTIVCNNAALGAINTGVVLNGRAFTTNGALTTTAITATMTPGCGISAIGIISQPTSKTVCKGSPVSFSVSATGIALTYQWRKGNANLNNGGNISGATSSTLTINPVNTSDASAAYNVIVRDSSLAKDTSNNVSLIVNSAPTINTEPVDKRVCTGSSANFTVNATGTGLTYQWKKGSVNILNNGHIVGATSASLTINPVSIVDTSVQYNVVVTGTCTPKKTSVNVSLSLCATGIDILGSDNANNAITLYPNPFTNSAKIVMNEDLQLQNIELRIYDILGTLVLNTTIAKKVSNLDINLPAGVYIYQVIGNNKTIQSGRLISQQ